MATQVARDGVDARALALAHENGRLLRALEVSLAENASLEVDKAELSARLEEAEITMAEITAHSGHSGALSQEQLLGIASDDDDGNEEEIDEEIDDEVDRAAAVTALQEEAAALRSRVEELEGAVDALQRAFDDVNGRYVDSATRADAVAAAVQAQHRQLAEASTVIQAQQRQLDQAETAVRALKAQLAEAAGRERELQGRHDAVQEQHDEAAEELEYLEVDALLIVDCRSVTLLTFFSNPFKQI